jgi:hypothetical protein
MINAGDGVLRSHYGVLTSQGGVGQTTKNSLEGLEKAEDRFSTKPES